MGPCCRPPAIGIVGEKEYNVLGLIGFGHVIRTHSSYPINRTQGRNIVRRLIFFTKNLLLNTIGGHEKSPAVADLLINGRADMSEGSAHDDLNIFVHQFPEPSNGHIRFSLIIADHRFNLDLFSPHLQTTFFVDLLDG